MGKFLLQNSVDRFFAPDNIQTLRLL